MAAQKGKNLKIKRGDGGAPEAFTLVAGLRSKTLRVNNNQVDVTTDDDVDAAGVTWQTFLPGIIAFEVSGDGVSKDETTMKDLTDDALTGASVNYQIEVVGIGTFAGPMSISQLDFSGAHDGSLDFSATWTARAAIAFTPA